MRPSQIVCRAIPVIILAISWSLPAWGANPYKIYTLHRHEDQDILCDFYTVKKDDHIWQILRRKGRIAERDFPRFVSILQGLNPHVKDVDKIYPGQELLVPLKQTEAVKGPSGEGPRYITIPMIPDVLYRTQEVAPGDSVSKIVMARLGLKWYQIPEGYLQTFKRLNPSIKDLALIHPGQTIRIPELAAAQEPTQSQPDAAVPTGDSLARVVLARRDQAKLTPEETPLPSSTDTPSSEWDTVSLEKLISKSVRQLGGKFWTSGQCYFPVKGKDDLKLDLAAFPAMELQDGRHVILEMGQGLPKHVEAAISTFWKGLMVIPAAPRVADEVVLDKVFRAMLGKEVQKTLDLPASDDGIQVTLRGDWIFPLPTDKGLGPRYKCMTLIKKPEECTSPSVVEYLAKEHIQLVDILSTASKESKTRFSRQKVSKECAMSTIEASGQEAFVSGFASALGYNYEPRAPISFDYAGFQVESTANLVYGGKGFDLVVDFGTFYGETKSAIEATGVRVLLVKPDEEPITIAKNILRSIGIAYTENPVFFAANRQVSKTTSLAIPGILVSRANERALLTQAPLDLRLCRFLSDNRIGLLKIEPST